PDILASAASGDADHLEKGNIPKMRCIGIVRAWMSKHVSTGHGGIGFAAAMVPFQMGGGPILLGSLVHA
ncbi:hypothetical protein, partial [Klebsiella pneumoniae]|uniref:hypothetical protein n=1 Tax=Klebsiella pneumoniae TaxID=573 RepID=UPI0028F73BE7